MSRNEIKTLTVEEAKSVVWDAIKDAHRANPQGDRGGPEPMLDLGGLTTLCDGVAKVLAVCEGRICLDGLTALSDEAAKGLGQHKGTLYLNGLTSLSDEAAKGLGQHKGTLYLNGLTTLSGEAAAALRTNPNVRLPSKLKP